MTEMPNGGRGVIAKMAKNLRIHPTLMSLILKGKRELSMEQALDLAGYLKLSEWETEYFLLLNSLARAGTSNLKNFFQKKIRSYQRENRKIDRHLKNVTTLSEADQARFYSSWVYSALRLHTSTKPTGSTIEDYVDSFQWSREHLMGFLDFLIYIKMIRKENERYFLGPQHTFISSQSPLVVNHHKNWRHKAIEKSDQITPQELMLTAPCTLSTDDFLQLREMITHFFQRANSIINGSPPERLACLNIDLFWVLNETDKRPSKNT